ncbi:dipeptidase [Halalkalibacterium halodurans]|uniref:dipeptidase n=1 Tax=Halalkalibacterium halodurans TaxID=86665 RepID=UPI0010671BC9|nr:dipeptidase [Halalkalibacterium halodurans]TES51550.1 dipeptidase [Halalkalibacterium halodurans]
MNDVRTYLEQKREEHLDELKQLLAIPSVSALSEHKEDVRKAAAWFVDTLQKAGLEHVEMIETKGHPLVYADWLHAKGKPTVLIYGHYDVQPVDPINLWETPPFEPSIREGKIFARGATDDKGQTFMHIKALEALLKTEGTLPVNVKLIIEGEEEIGSPNLDPFVEQEQNKLQADVLVISDTPMLGKGKPAICTGLRGLCSLQIDVKGTKGDLHSGLYGGAVQNSVHALVQLLDSMRNEKGQVMVEGFYDDVVDASPEERESFARLDHHDDEMKDELGVTELFGEEGFSTLERTWIRPTLEINGIYGGFQGEGVKTVIPSEAHAKITCRLVPDQDPDQIASLIEKHIEAHTPPGVKVTTTRFDTGRPFAASVGHPAIQAAARSYETIYGEPAVFTRMGGSIPVVETFHRLMKLPIVLMGFGLPSENFHAPNEHFHLENFDKGLVTLCHYWHELANIEEN